MPDVSFNEPNYGRTVRSGKPSALSSMVIKAGLAKDEAGAQKALMGIAILAIILAVVVWIYGNPSAAPQSVGENAPIE